MRVYGLVMLAVMSAALALPESANAQFSPRGIIGAVTSPLRHLFGRLPIPHVHRRQTEPQRTEETAATVNSMATAADTRLAQLGPPAWPTVYADVVGYAFWPNDYAPIVKDRGFDLIAQTISGPFRATDRRVAKTTGAAAQDSAQKCGALAENDNWPAVQVEKAVQLTQPQQQKLQKVQAQFDAAIKSQQIDCGNANDLAPPQRLDNLIQVLWAVRDTGLSVRDALRDFDDSLTAGEQKVFTSRQNTPPPQTTGSATGEANKALQACAAQNVGAAERMIKELEQRVRPSKEQRANLEKLHKVSTDMAKMLSASCAEPVPNDSLARLDAIDDRLTTLNYAATAVQIAFADFYNGLDEQQKASFKASAR